MSAPPAETGEPITDRRQLVEDLEAGCRPSADWRIGTEHEKFAYTREDLRPLPFEGARGIEALLEGLAAEGWQRIREHGRTVALHREGCNITLEPGGQLELSGAPLETLHETCREVNAHLEHVKRVAGPMDVGMLGMGFHPKWRRQDMPWMPKGRYAIMRRYMPQRGGLGLDMMLRTCTVQVNLDYASEADMVRKFRVGLALQPVATALFANSPFTDGRPNGFMSYRSHVWEDTDPDRCGILPFVFEAGMGFERYVDYVLDVPMYFVYREGEFIDVAGQSFRDFLEARLPGYPGHVATKSDWSDHLTTLFPEVRLKRFLEMRGADGGPWRSLCALPALWVGLLYEPDCLAAAWDLVKDWPLAEHHRLRREVPRHALETPVGGETMREFALRVLEIADTGLARRARRDGCDPDGRDERHYLTTLWEIAESGRCPARDKLARYHGDWGGSVDPIFTECAY